MIKIGTLMHLAFVTSLVPDGAPSTGYEIANAAIIDALRRQDVRVSVVGFVRPGKQPLDPGNTIVLGALDPTTDDATLALKIRWLIRSLKTGLPFSSAKLKTLPDSAFEAALAQAGEVDGYVLNAVQMSAAFEASLFDRPAIYLAHNVEHLSATENARSAKGMIRRALYAREARLLKIIERRLCKKARFVFTLAEPDRQALGVANSGRSSVLPLVTRKHAAPALNRRATKYDAGLIGTWTWQPNRVGLDWFLREVVPHLDPDFRIAVAGSVPRDLTTGHANVEFLGRVECADSFVRTAGVIPLISRGGTGVQLKTIETFELGLPAVATRSAVRGISMIPDNCVVTNEPAKFARAMETLCRCKNNEADGSVFFSSQLASLDKAIATGVHALGRIREAEPA